MEVVELKVFCFSKFGGMCIHTRPDYLTLLLSVGSG